MAYSADKKPGELTALTTLATDDVFVVGDTSDASEVAKGITKANLITDLGSSFAPALGADDNYVTDAEKAALHTHANKATLDNITAAYTTAEATKLGHISITQAVDLDALETASHAAVTVTDSSEIDFTLTGQDITASLKSGSIDETKLDTSVNASLDLADSAVQPAGLSGYFQTANIDDTPVNGETAAPISSNWAYDHAATAASDTTAGHVELAIGSEVTTGTDATRAITPDALAGSEPGKRSVYILVSDPGGSAITTGDGKACVAIDTTINGMNLVAAKSYCTTVSSSGNPTVQLRRSRRTNATTRSDADMLSTALSIDANEFESADATTAVGINTSNDDVQTGDMIFVDIDTAGTGCKGLGVLLTFQTP